ncbi:NUDIX-domain-containing protein [Exidia glandulosa HHB12029]|uniref:NUDIX-domain-containing protein n=1 Tax=Exidia glandulosa HHB12029 TaxID=1314781 RepID=A0A165BER4_EXIGL|nr:NUDIX-domain-containing protein [Exidia glandulosa HHB12029]
MSSSFSIAPALANFDVPLSTLTNSDDNAGKRLVVGVAIARRSASGHLPKVLLVQRASHEQLFPDMYELPGGKCESTDGTLLDTVARETFEETGYRVTRVVAEFPGFEYSTPKGDARQYNFIVTVDGGSDSNVDPTLDPKEHQAFAWVDDSEYKAYPMSEAMRLVVADALSAIVNVRRLDHA